MVLLPRRLPSRLVINPFQIQPSLLGMILINEQSSFSIPPLNRGSAVDVLALTTAHASGLCFRDCSSASLLLKGSILCVIPFAIYQKAPPRFLIMVVNSKDKPSLSVPATQGHPDWETKQVITQGLCEDGLYVLRDTPMALAATVGVPRKASFKLWHNRLGHDGRTEFVNHTVQKFFEDNGILHRLSCPYTPQQNGRAERKHRHLVEIGLAMLFHAHVPASYWVDAFSSATYIINRLPINSNAHKLAPRKFKFILVFLLVTTQYNVTKCLDPDSSRIYITRHARFDEVTFPFASTANPNALSTLQLCTFLEDGPPISDAPS
ncbi:retrovirus-related pol polyprotein from transposon RE1 [Tanacetum coccineum]